MRSTKRPSIATIPGSLEALRGVGPEVARKLRARDIRTPRDLALTYPRAYKDWRSPTPIADIVRNALAGGASDDETSEEIAVGTVTSLREYRARIAITSVELDDGTGTIKATWFGRRGFAGKLDEGDRLFVHGRVAVRRGRRGAGAEMTVLHHRILAPGEPYVGRIVPIYPASKDVPSRVIASAIERNLDTLEALIADVLPRELERRHGFPTMREAWRRVHAPLSLEQAAESRERLVFEEFFALALAAALKRAQRSAAGGAEPITASPGLVAQLEATIGFPLTGAQRRVIGDIFGDLTRAAPMNRLLQGDVGSGKTLVAAAAVLAAARAGVQSALMAPTEILAAQHAAKLAPLLLSFGITVDAVMGSQGARARNDARARLASGACDLAVGTHALLTEDVEFKRLGLAIVDEQHRFGVMQRAKLRAKSRAPHTLYMTATPIPRTLAQTQYADLDLSTIDELPPGRTPVRTFVLRTSRKSKAYDFVRASVARGRQAFVVVPAIDPSGEENETESAITNAVDEFEQLSKHVFADLRVALLHGRMPAREKDAVMTAVLRRDVDVLLATTVVEVGVDVPNATVMVVLDAHRYGLAQLHQLRGRVGRGADESFCVLIAPDARGDVERLSILERTNDGFKIAEEDLRLRQAGEFAGTAQTGGGGLLGDVYADFALYMRAKADADAVVAKDPDLSRPENAPLHRLLDDSAGARAMLVSS